MKTGSSSAGPMRLATFTSVIVASVFVVAKPRAWIQTGSVNLLASLVDSLLDVGASIVNLFTVLHALQPADPEHCFAHGKAKLLAVRAQAVFIAGSGVFF